MPTDMKLPELGENVESGDVLRVLVAPGDQVQIDQPVLELETDKATFEVPSSVVGVVKEIKVKVGDKVKVGQPVLVVDEGAGNAKPSAAPAKAAVASSPEPRTTGGAVAVSTPAAATPSKQSAPAPEPRRRAEVVEMTRPAKPSAESAPASQSAGALAAAAPSTRRLARELGITLEDVQGSGPGGRISMDDVAAFARKLMADGGSRPAAAPLPDFTAWGEVERKPMSGVRRTTAHRLTQAWTTIPHVVQHDRADITGLEALRKRLSKKAEAGGAPALTLTAFALPVLAAALKKFPQFNSSVDLQTDEIIYKEYIHIGVAVDTDRGLLVPVIRNVDQKNLFDLGAELTALAEKARARKLSANEMQGGSFTISNLGGLGGTSFSPIINWPEVALLGISRASIQPVYLDGRFEPRLMLPLSLSYDHRAIDGADAVRFLRWVVEALEQPALLWLDS